MTVNKTQYKDSHILNLKIFYWYANWFGNMRILSKLSPKVRKLSYKSDKTLHTFSRPRTWHFVRDTLNDKTSVDGIERDLPNDGI